jgi:hypothetical protein
VGTLRTFESSASGIGFGLLAIVLFNTSRDWSEDGVNAVEALPRKFSELRGHIIGQDGAKHKIYDKVRL